MSETAASMVTSSFEYPGNPHKTSTRDLTYVGKDQYGLYVYENPDFAEDSEDTCTHLRLMDDGSWEGCSWDPRYRRAFSYDPTDIVGEIEDADGGEALEESLPS